MMRFTRPAQPANFEAEVEQARKDAAQKRGRPKFKFAEVWRDFKPFFSKAQCGRCGYCDGGTTGMQPGDVEHYAPKSAVKVLGPDMSTWGQEAENSSSVKGRKPVPLSDDGYWWLAYEWKNYLLACSTCNSGWKGTIFPVHEPPDRTVPPDQMINEKALLLNPFSGPHPAKHLRFNEDGSVEPWKGSRRGRETINTVGLDRLSIRMYRRGSISDAKRAIRRLYEAGAAGDEARKKDALDDLVSLGEVDRPYAGCVRAVAEQDLRLPWKKIEEAAGG